MSRFNRTKEFEREYKRLKKKYRSLDGDFELLEKVLELYPVGNSQKFNVLHEVDGIKIVKVRLACRDLRQSSLRVVYAYEKDIVTFVYIELYFKGDKAREDSERYKKYLKDRDAG
jgi:hypothetical protein